MSVIGLGLGLGLESRILINIPASHRLN